MILPPDHYLFRLRAAAIRQPVYNAHQLAALSHIASVAARVGSVEALLEETRQFEVLTLATQMDRSAGIHRLAQDQDDPWLAGTSGQPGRWRALFQRLMLGLISAHAGEGWLDPVRAGVEDAMSTLCALDAAFRPGVWAAQPRYQRRWPWSVEVAEEWLRPLWPTAMPVQMPGLLESPVPIALETYDGIWPDVEPLPLPLIPAQFDAVLARQADWPDAVLEAFAREANVKISAAGTSIARELVSLECALDYDTICCRNSLEWAVVLSPLRCRYWGEASAIERNHAAVPALTGKPVEEWMQSSRVRDFLERNLEPAIIRGPEGFGAYPGEGGHEVVHLCRFSRGIVIPSTKE